MVYLRQTQLKWHLTEFVYFFGKKFVCSVKLNMANQILKKNCKTYCRASHYQQRESMCFNTTQVAMVLQQLWDATFSFTKQFRKFVHFKQFLVNSWFHSSSAFFKINTDVKGSSRSTWRQWRQTFWPGVSKALSRTVQWQRGAFESTTQLVTSWSSENLWKTSLNVSAL